MENVIEQLQQDIDLLNKYHYLHLNKLSKNDELYQVYQRFISGLHLLPNSQPVINILKNMYQPTNINANTIGSSLYGCIQAYYGDIDRNCSILCIDSPLNNNSSCDKQIWLQVTEQADLRFICLHNTSSNQALIYVLPSFKVLTNTEKTSLNKYGVEECQILDTLNSKHYSRTRMIPLSELPDDNDQDCQENYWKFSSLPLPPSDRVVWEEEKDSTNFYVISGLLIICIIIVILFLAFSF